MLDDDNNNELLLQCIPAALFGIYMGLVSGYIPSPLYDRGERWPRWYVAVQLCLLALTSLRLQPAPPGYQRPELDYTDMLESTSFWGSNFKALVLEGGFRNVFWPFMVGLTVIYNAAQLFQHHFLSLGGDKENSKQKSGTLWMFLRNFALFAAFTAVTSMDGLLDGDEAVHYCHQYNPHGNWAEPNRTLGDVVQDFASQWPKFHPPHFWFIRLSHACLYPTILLCLTQRKWTKLAVWFVFIEIDFFHAIADMIHYASDPDVAEERELYNDGKTYCFFVGYYICQLLAYPLNFVYLTTPFGDKVVV